MIVFVFPSPGFLEQVHDFARIAQPAGICLGPWIMEGVIGDLGELLARDASITQAVGRAQALRQPSHDVTRVGTRFAEWFQRSSCGRMRHEVTPCGTPVVPSSA